MTTYYVDSAGSNTAPYDTWAKAANLLATIVAIPIADNDIVYIASSSSETTAGTLSYNWAQGNKIISADKTSGEPPTVIQAGAQVATSGNSAIVVNGGANYVELSGVYFTAGNSTGNTSITTSVKTYCDTCSFILGSSGSASTINATSSLWKNCSVKFSAAGQDITPANGFRWIGGSLLAGGTSPTNLMSSASAWYEVVGIDLSNASTTINLSTNTNNAAFAKFRKCKMPSGWVGAGNVGSRGASSRFEFYDMGVGTGVASTYDKLLLNPVGYTFNDPSIYRVGGATDGSTPVSHQIFCGVSGFVFFPGTPDFGPDIEIWNTVVGQPITITMEFIHDSLTGLKDTEFGFEVLYPAYTGTDLRLACSHTYPDNFAAAGTTLTSSTATWVGTFTNPNKQKASVTITPQQIGLLYIRAAMWKSSYTVNYCPKVVIT